MTRFSDIGCIGADFGTVMAYTALFECTDTSTTSTESEKMVTKTTSLWEKFKALIGFSPQPQALAARATFEASQSHSEEDGGVFIPEGRDEVAAPSYQASVTDYTERDRRDITKWEAPKKSFLQTIRELFERCSQKKEKPVDFMPPEFFMAADPEEEELRQRDIY